MPSCSLRVSPIRLWGASRVKSHLSLQVMEYTPKQWTFQCPPGISCLKIEHPISLFHPSSQAVASAGFLTQERCADSKRSTIRSRVEREGEKRAFKKDFSVYSSAGGSSLQLNVSCTLYIFLHKDVEVEYWKHLTWSFLTPYFWFCYFLCCLAERNWISFKRACVQIMWCFCLCFVLLLYSVVYCLSSSLSEGASARAIGPHTAVL